MSILSTLATDDTIANERDIVGGGSRILESGVYDAKVVHAYVSKSAGGAIGMNVLLKTTAGQELRQTFWMTSGTAKGCKNYYQDKNGEKQYLPGFLLANSLCLLTVGKEIAELETEQKVIPLWNNESKSEIPTKVDMLMDLVGQDITAGVIKQIVDKTRRNEVTGLYEPTGETREENEVDKFFRSRDKMTTAEIRAQADKATFIETWSTKNNGKTRDKSKGAANGAAPAAGLPKAGAAGAAAAKRPTQSLFA